MADTLKEKRLLKDRRKFCYTSYSPERRSGIDRRQISLKTIKEKVA